ncbi:MAG: prepilin-type N-terminal cleavage/methylation domain-containing protein [Pseudomonadota bacterium]
MSQLEHRSVCRTDVFLEGRDAPRRRRPERGFSLFELLIAMFVMVFGAAAAMTMYRTMLTSNVGARDIDRARMLAEQTMEELRGQTVAQLVTAQTTAGGPPVALPATVVAGVTYRIRHSTTAVAGQTNLVLVAVEVGYSEEGGAADAGLSHLVRLEMIRTRGETI